MASLIAMAREGTKRSRQLLAENVLDLVVSQDGRLSDHARALTDQVLTNLVKSMEVQVRRELALRLVDLPHAPDGLLAMLAKDEILVAGPLLECSRILKDSTLVEVVQMRTREHQLCIAMRENLSTTVSDALVEHAAEPDILEALIRNPNASISEASMAYLVAESRRFDQFQEPLLSRADLPAELAHKMFWWVSVQLRQKILSDFNIEEHEVDPLLEAATKDILAETEAERAGTARAKAETLAKTLKDEGQLTVELLIDMLRKNRIPAFCASMSHLAGISFSTVYRIILDKDITPFAILCKAIKLNEAHFSTMALLVLHSQNNKQQSAQQLQNLLRLFKEITSDQAQKTLTYWHNDSELQKAALKIK
ncbi:MAG: DUF2336 domain-containing protein [Pseudomonadota bacterium]